MNDELHKSIRKLQDLSATENLLHLFKFESNSVAFQIDKSNNNALWFMLVVFILAPSIQQIYLLCSQGLNWMMLAVDLMLILWGISVIKTRMIDTKQVVQVDLLNETIILKNNYPKISKRQDPLVLQFDQIAQVDVVEISTGHSWWQKHQRLIFENHSGEVIAYLNLCASLEIRPIAKGIKLFLNASINPHKDH